MTIPILLTPGKIVADDPKPLRLYPEHLSRHIFIGGGSGNGKSKLLELLCRQLIAHGCGFTFLDPHGDSAEALMQYLAVSQADPSRIHYLRAAQDYCFSFDPFASAPRGVSMIEYESWLVSTVDRTTDAFLRRIALADQEAMSRLQRWLGNILYVCGFDVDGKHAGLSAAPILTDPSREEEFSAILNRVRPHMRTEIGREILSDFAKLASTRGASQQEKWVESTINLLRKTLSPVMRLIGGQHSPSINMRDVILQRGMQIINLRKNSLMSRKQRAVVGGLLLNFLMDAAENIAEELPFAERVPHYLIIDEAETFIGEELRMAFKEMRKFKLSVCIAVQNLKSLRLGDLDLMSEVVSQCGLQMTFQQQDPDDVEYLAKSFGYGSLDLTPLFVDHVMPDGYDWVPTMSMQVGASWNRGNSHNESATQSHSETRQTQTAASIQEMVSHSLSESHTEGHSTSRTRSRSAGHSGGSNWSSSFAKSHQYSSTDGIAHSHTNTEGSSHGTSHADGTVRPPVPGRDPTRSSNDARSEGTTSASSDGNTQSHARTEGVGRTDTRGHGGNQGWNRTTGDARGEAFTTSDGRTVGDTTGSGRTETTGNSEGASDGTSLGETDGTSQGEGGSIGVTFSTTPLPKQKIVQEPSGKTVVAVADQLSAIMNTLGSLADRMVLVKCKGMGSPFVLRVHDVHDPYEERRLIRSPAWKADDLQRLLDRIRAAHPYYFSPREFDPLPATEPEPGDTKGSDPAIWGDDDD